MLAKRQRTAPSRSIRYYLWPAEGLQRITQRFHRNLFERTVALPRYAGTKQKIVEVFIQRLTSRDYSISARGIVYPFDAKGFLDIKALALEGSLELSRFKSTETNILDLRPSIKRRRFHASALLFDKKPRKSFSKGENVRFPKKVKIGDVIGAIREKHPMLGSVLSKGAGFHLMYLESEIMMHVLEKLRHQNIVGLPVFDGVIVKASKVEIAKRVMKEQFNKTTGLEIQVRLEQTL